MQPPLASTRVEFRKLVPRGDQSILKMASQEDVVLKSSAAGNIQEAISSHPLLIVAKSTCPYCIEVRRTHIWLSIDLEECCVSSYLVHLRFIAMNNTTSPPNSL